MQGGPAPPCDGRLAAKLDAPAVRSRRATKEPVLRVCGSSAGFCSVLQPGLLLGKYLTSSNDLDYKSFDRNNVNMSEDSTLSQHDCDVLRRLGARKRELSEDPVNVERRQAWYALDSGERERTMVLAEFGGVRDEKKPVADDRMGMCG